MGQLLGLLNIAEAAADRTFVQTVGQQQVYDAVKMLLNAYNTELEKAKKAFVERTTSDHKFRYKLPGGGKLQRRGGMAQSGAVKAGGYWDVAFPLEDFGAQFGGDDITLAYMSAAELDRHIDTIFIQDKNTVRYEMLRAIFNSTQKTFVDDIRGSLTVEPLANGDSVVYPPVVGSETEATDTHYLESGYLASAISDTNNPYPVIRAELVEHFGVQQGGDNVAIMINSAQTPLTKALATFDSIVGRYLIPGANADQPTNLPQGLPGNVIGFVSPGGWVVEWDWIPAGYMLGLHLDAPKPLIERIDPADTGLGTGLQLVAEDEEYPLKGSHYRHRFGFGAGNRLNGVVMELANGGGYTIPTAYA